MNVHNLVSELFKLGPLERFCEEVGDHISGGAILDGYFFGCNSISYEKISDVNMSGPFAAGTLTVLFKKDGTLIVLIHDVLRRVVTLCGEEISSPQHLWHDVVYADQFRLRGTAGINLLSGRGAVDGSFTKSHVASSMSLHVWVHRKGGVDVPFDNTHVTGLERERHVDGTAQVTHDSREFLIIICIRIFDPGAQE